MDNFSLETEFPRSIYSLLPHSLISRVILLEDDRIIFEKKKKRRIGFNFYAKIYLECKMFVTFRKTERRIVEEHFQRIPGIPFFSVVSRAMQWIVSRDIRGSTKYPSHFTRVSRVRSFHDWVGKLPGLSFEVSRGTDKSDDNLNRVSKITPRHS